MEWLYSVTLALTTLAFTLHICGMYLLLKKRFSTNQRFLLLHLSTSEIGFCVGTFTRIGLIFCGYKTSSEYAVVVVHSLHFPFYIGIFLLTLERFLEIYLHMYYINCWFYKRKKVLSIISWCIGIAHISLTFFIHKVYGITVEEILNIDNKFFMVLSLLLAIVFGFVYTYIFLSLQKLEIKKRRRTLRHALIPFFIALSYIFFMAIPDIIIITHTATDRTMDYMRLLWRINLIGDAIIYIFLQPSIRRRLKHIFTHKDCNISLRNIRHERFLHQRIVDLNCNIKEKKRLL